MVAGQEEHESFLVQTNWLQLNMEAFRSLTPKQQQFLSVFPEKATVRATCNEISISITTFYNWVHTSTVFKRCFDTVKEFQVLAMEDEAVRRATVGTVEDIFYQGIKCGERTVYSDSLMMFLLRAANPEKYRERSSLELTAPPVVANDSPFKDLPKDVLIKIKQLIASARAPKTIDAATETA